MGRKAPNRKGSAAEPALRPQSDHGAGGLLGGFDQDRRLIDLHGNVMQRTTSSVTVNVALALIREGAYAATEVCGCGGWQGCQPEWLDTSGLERLRAGDKPRRVKSGAPTWIDVWRSDASVLVFAHGDIRWDTKGSSGR